MKNENEFPVLDPESENFKEDLKFNLWSTQSNSDYRNDRERPYNGQPWTDDGIRGQTEVKGLTLRDIKDCFIKALLQCGASDEYLEKDFMKCWDFTGCDENGTPPKPTQYLLDNQDKYVSTKVDTGNWRPQDVFKLELNKIDPLAVAQNLTCEIEKMMGIFPNIK